LVGSLAKIGASGRLTFRADGLAERQIDRRVRAVEIDTANAIGLRLAELVMQLNVHDRLVAFWVIDVSQWTLLIKSWWGALPAPALSDARLVRL
jgi:hypothetical protein